MKHRFKKIGRAILLAVLVLVVLIYAPVWDTAPPDVADLVVVRADVPPEENAYTYFLQATNTLRRITDFSPSQYLQGLTNDEALVSAYIATNRAVITWIRRGVERRHCQLPLVEEWSPTIITELPISAFLEIGRLIAIQARFDRVMGRMDEATDATLLLMRYGNRLQHASGLVIDYLVASAIVRMGLTQAENLARDPGCGAAEQQRLIAGLTDLGTPAPGLELAAKGESTYSADMLKKINAGEVDSSYLYYGFDLKRSLILLVGRAARYPNYFMQYNRTRHLINDTYRLLIAHSSATDVDHPLREIDSAMNTSGKQGTISNSRTTGLKHPRRHSNQSPLPFANAIGRKIWKYLGTTSDGIVQATCRQESHRSGVRLLLACRAYEDATGRMPETLASLVPDYLPAVPRDPFDGAPFRYSAGRRLVYSVGENLVDDGGTDGRQQGRRRAKDLVFELER